MSLLDDPGIAVSISIFFLGVALGLPNIDFGMFGLDFSKFSPTVIAVMRIGIIGVALGIGLKPIENKGDGGYI